MRCTLTNISPLPRQTWVTVTLPRSRSKSLPIECTFLTDDGRRFRAVRGRDVGIKTVMRVRITLGGNESVKGTIIAKQHPDAGEHRTHPWVYDDLAEMIPSLGVANDGEHIDAALWSNLLDIQIVEESPAHRRFRVHQRLPFYGLHFTTWIDVPHDDPVCPFWSRVTWSERNNTANARRFPHLVWKAGEACSFDFKKRHGIQDAVPIQRNWMQLLNSEPIVFGDGMSLPVTGRMLAFDSNYENTAPSDAANPNNADLRSLGDLAAGAHGPAIGVCHEWDHDWLAARNVPRFREDHTAEFYALSDWNQFQQMMQTTAGWLADRPFGLARYPGQTGDQEDFGASKGTNAVVALDARSIYVMQYSAHGDMLRGCCHFDADGRELSLALHPEWVSWSRQTHWHSGVSRDRLGKDVTMPYPQGGYLGIDDEHASMNYVAAYAALTDDPMLGEHFGHLLTTDKAGYRFRFPEWGSGATRAQGRTAGMWAQLASVAPDEVSKGFVELLAMRMLYSSHIETLYVPGPMKVVAVGGPDVRKGIFWPDGSMAPWTSMWELGLFMVGLTQAKNSGKLAPDQLVPVMTTCAETIAQFGFFEQNGQWFTVDDILWSGGEPPPGGLVNPSLHITSHPGAGALGSWTFAGVLAAREILPRTHPLRARCNDYIQGITHGEEAWDRKSAEWWAVAETIVRRAP